MTSVLPVQTVTLAVSAQETASDQATRPFAELLDLATLTALQRKQRSIYAFSELGMFGRHGALADPVQRQDRICTNAMSNSGPSLSVSPNLSMENLEPGTSPASLAADLPAPMTRDRLADNGFPAQRLERSPGVPDTLRADVHSAQRLTWSTQAVARSIVEESPLAGASGDAPPSNQPTNGMARLAAGTRGQLPATAAGIVEGPSEPVTPMGSAGAGRASPARTTAASVNIVVAETGSTIAVAVRADGAIDAARLRARLDEAAAEFGVQIAEAHFNGSKIESSSSIITGGQHGRRSR